MAKKRKKITIDFACESDSLPFIWVRFGGMDKPKLALIDSGSQITMLDRSVAEEIRDTAKIVLRKANDDVILDGVGGTKTHDDAVSFASFVEVTDEEGNPCSITLDGISVDMGPIASALKNACSTADTVMIIGSDTFRKLKAKIDYKKKKVLLHDILCDE